MSTPPTATLPPPPPPPQPRKFPPPCWTHDETLALIESYRNKWFSLRRTNLRSPDWDAVCDAVTRRCPNVIPAKTSVQCRHKIEKLRKRYRTEKQRSLAYPGRFNSSWFFYNIMDSMEAGSTFVPNKKIKIDPEIDSESKILRNHGPNFDFDGIGIDSGGGFRPKTAYDHNSANLGFRGKNYGQIEGNFMNPNVDFDENVDLGSGFRVKGSSDWNSVNLGFRAKSYGGIEGNSSDYNVDFDHGMDGEGGYGMKPRQRSSIPRGFGSKDGNGLHSDFESRVFGFGKRSGGVKSKREIDPIAEMVMSIKMLGEGFIRMEKMKMDMAREMEKMRMEMELKRNEMILESQRQIVDAFVQGILEKKKNKKAKAMVPNDSYMEHHDSEF